MAVGSLPGKFLYAVLFCIALPALLVWWGGELVISQPLSPALALPGWIAIITGGLLIAEAMWRLWSDGGGLPMNAYPPENYVRSGAYQLFRHPIYVGFCLCCAGVSMVLSSSAGLYVITPVVALLCISLVAGFEGISLKKRFGAIEHPVLFGVCAESDAEAGWRQKAGVFINTFIPWFALYKFTIYATASAGLVNTMTAFEEKWPVLPAAEIPYASTYLFAAFTPFVLNTKNQLRRFQLNAWHVTAGGVFLQFVLPLYAQAREFRVEGFLGQLIMLERKSDGMNAAFPSFHVMWALTGAVSWSEAFPSAKKFWWLAASLMILSCIGVGVHSIADVLAGIAVFAGIAGRAAIWQWLNKRSELIANSWYEWRWGNFRVINHSVYAGVAAMLGFFIGCQFFHDSNALLIVISCSLAGGVLWGQFIEGSNRLLRPFGYFGAILGGIAGLLLIRLMFGHPVVIPMAAIAIVAPIVQAAGRLRCLVQGCCHGRLTHSQEGIRYINEHSRVCQISGLKGKKVYNTQLYSILFNLATGLILFRVWYAGCSPALIAGLYFILAGATRFVEEAFRGETQTRVISGLPVYQWMSIASIIAGIVITTAPVSAPLVWQPDFGVNMILKSIATGILWAFAMGMDFPESRARFSRLSG